MANKDLMFDIARFAVFTLFMIGLLVFSIGTIKQYAENSEYCSAMITGKKITFPLNNISEIGCFEYCKVIDEVNPGMFCNHSSTSS